MVDYFNAQVAEYGFYAVVIGALFSSIVVLVPAYMILSERTLRDEIGAAAGDVVALGGGFLTAIGLFAIAGRPLEFVPFRTLLLEFETWSRWAWETMLDVELSDPLPALLSLAAITAMMDLRGALARHRSVFGLFGSYRAPLMASFAFTAIWILALVAFYALWLLDLSGVPADGWQGPLAAVGLVVLAAMQTLYPRVLAGVIIATGVLLLADFAGAWLQEFVADAPALS
jgi:hypothetical protein